MNIVITGEILSKEAHQVLAPLGITEVQFNVLMLLAYQSDGELTQTRLGDMLLVNRSNVTGLIDRTEKAGWVRRVSTGEDRRVYYIQITPEGKNLLTRAHRVYYARVEEIMADLSREDWECLSNLTERVRRRARM
jgi:DNA-binding MarR family transcriptional regulator